MGGQSPGRQQQQVRLLATVRDTGISNFPDSLLRCRNIVSSVRLVYMG